MGISGNPDWIEAMDYESQFCPDCWETGAHCECREPAQPVPLGPCGHPAWSCACKKWREPIERVENDPTVQHEPATTEGY